MRGDIHIADIVHGLERHSLLPAIVFRTSRNQCDMDAERAGRRKSLHLPPDKQREIRLSIKEIIQRYELDAELITTHPHYQGLIMTAIGAHHAGQLLMWRLLLEELMAAGELRTLIATGTVAAGVDFPARTVVITAHSKRGADGFNTLTAAEFQQMSGRAGRRGKDAVGFCVAAPAPFCDARALLKISKKPPEPLRSAYFPSPSTVLNLLRYRNVDDLQYTVSRSLASFVDKKDAVVLREQADKAEIKLEESPEDKKAVKRVRRLRRQADELDKRQSLLLDKTLGGLRELGYLEDINLSEKGYWSANLCTNLVLELAEIIESGMLEGVSAERLVAIVASIAGDSYRDYLPYKQSPLTVEDSEKIQEIVNKVATKEIPGVLEARDISLSAAYTAVLWMRTDTWQEFRSVLFLQGVTEGDVARLITQTAEQLNQITRLSDTFEKLAYRAEEGKRLLLRPPLTEVINLESI